MSDNTRIEWTTNTWNPWQGCHRVSEGCDNCYMHAAKKRYGQDPTRVVRSKNATFFRPLRKGGKRWKSGDMVFTCSWSDFFIRAADDWRHEAWEIIRQRPDLIFQILTKRTHLIADRLPADWGEGWPNVWLGATIENQPNADKRVPELLPIPAAVRFVSIEPMLGPVDLSKWIDRCSYYCDHDEDGGGHRPERGLDWVIVGAETGPSKRPMEIDWALGVRDQCESAGVPFFFKKDSFGKHALDGKIYEQFPHHCTEGAT